MGGSDAGFLAGDCGGAVLAGTCVGVGDVSAATICESRNGAQCLTSQFCKSLLILDDFKYYWTSDDSQEGDVM